MAQIPSASLVGLVSMAPTGQGFLLPVFFSPQYSNSYLVQALGSSTEIRGFNDLVSEEQVIPIQWDGIVSVGDEPLWAFQVTPDAYVVEKASKFRQALEDVLKKRKIHLEPFVRWEVERLFGRSDQRQAAVKNLHRTLATWNKDWADYWLANLLILPTIRQQLEQVALRRSDAEMAGAIKSLQVECTTQGVFLDVDSVLVSWIQRNNEKFRDAMEMASEEWRGTGIGTQFYVSVAKATPKPREVRIPLGRRGIDQIAPARFVPSPLFSHGRIIFDRSWSSYERTLGMSLVDDIANKLSTSGVEVELERLRLKQPSSPIFSYSAKASDSSPSRYGRGSPKASAPPAVRIVCGSDYKFLFGLLRKSPKTLALRPADINILLFRSRDEAEEVLTKLEGLVSYAKVIADIWIAEPRSPDKQLELSFLEAGTPKRPKYLGYIQPPRKRFSFQRSLPNLYSGRYFLVVADAQTIPEAEFIARLMAAAKVSPQPGPIDVVICIVGEVRETSRIVKLSLPGVHVVYVSAPPFHLLQRAFAVFSTLGAFASGMFASVRAPIVLLRSDRKRDSTIAFAASSVKASIADIHPSSPLERESRISVRRALTDATHEVQYSATARHRSSSSRARLRAVEYYEDLARERQNSR